jgi:hypothetical protein
LTSVTLLAGSVVGVQELVLCCTPFFSSRIAFTVTPGLNAVWSDTWDAVLPPSFLNFIEDWASFPTFALWGRRLSLTHEA